MKKEFSWLCVWMVLLLFACIPRSWAQQPPYGGILRVGWVGEPDTLNPLLSWSGWSNTVHSTFYEGLFTYAPNMSVVPALAQSYEVSDDGKTYTFHLRKNVRWHDGVPFTSKDVKFTFDFLKAGNFPWGAAWLMPYISGAEAPDDYTAIIHTGEPIAGLPDYLVFAIFPEHIWGIMTPAEALDFANDNPIGTGPFKFDEWKRGEYFKVVVNEDYWRGRPYIDGVIFKHYGTMDAVVLALLSGEIDVTAVGGLSATVIPTLEANPNIKVENMPSLLFNYIGFNLHPNSTASPLVKDKNVRVAIAHAINKTEIANLMYLGYATAGDSIMSPGSGLWYNPNIKHYDYDLDEARRILTDAGYIDRDGDGIRESPDGMKLEFNFYSFYESREVRLVPMLPDMLKPIGIKLNIFIVDEGTLDSIVYGEYAFDLDHWRWDGYPNPTRMMRIFLTSQIEKASDSCYSNPIYDQLFEQQMHEMDVNKRKEMVWQMEEIAYEDVPYIVTTYERAIHAYRTDTFTGYVPMTFGFIHTDNIWTLLQVHRVAPTTITTAQTIITTAQTTITTAQTIITTAQTTITAPLDYTPWIVAGALAVVAILSISITIMSRRHRPT